MGSKIPDEIAEKMEEIGEAKAIMPLQNIFILAILAGAYIGFGAFLATMVSHDTAAHLGVGVAKFLSGSVFSVGLMLVVIGGAELFTGNNLMIIPCMSKKVTPFHLAKNWIVVYIGNFMGSLLFVLLVYFSGLWKINSNLVGAAALNIANLKVNLPIGEAFARGVLCNWLVCLAVWIAISAQNTIGKIFGVYFPIMAFVASGYEHSIANMYFIPIGILLKGKSQVVTAPLLIDVSNLTWAHFLVDNLVPVTLGNIVGGAIFVGLLYWLVYCRSKSHNRNDN